MSWTIQDVTRATGVTSRTLRHYDEIGLLPASFTGPGGIRHYTDDALIRLQRILLLRDLGLRLSVIAEVVNSGGDTVAHLRTHLDLLHGEREALERRISAVRRTIEAKEGAQPMTKDMFDGFDHTQHEEEVTARWGADAYKAGDTWWRGQSQAEQAAWKAQVAQLSSDWIAAARNGEDPDGDAATRDLVPRVGCEHAATGGGQGGFIRAEFPGDILNAGLHFFQRQKLADDPGREDQKLLGLRPNDGGSLFGHAPAIGVASTDAGHQ